MIAQDPLEILAERVASLERQNRWQRRAMVAVPLVALLLGAAVAQVDEWKGKSVRTEKLFVLDEEGKERIGLYVHKGEPVLEVYNKDHSLLLNAGKSLENGVGFLQFFDSQGKFKGGVGGNSLK
jgi:hypothetical protein